MEAEPMVQQIYPLTFLLGSGPDHSLLVILIGAGMTIWGCFNLFFVRQCKVLAAQAIMSLLPGLIAAFKIYASCTNFARVASSSNDVSKSLFIEMMSNVICNGIWGFIATAIPTVIGIIALYRYASARDARDS